MDDLDLVSFCLKSSLSLFFMKNERTKRMVKRNTELILDAAMFLSISSGLSYTGSALTLLVSKKPTSYTMSWVQF